MEDKMVMNGPATFEMKVWIVNDDTEQCGQVTIGIGAFTYPTPELIAERIDGLEEYFEEQGLIGYRVATKAEAWRMVCMEKTGEVFATPGGQDWDPI